MLRARPPSSIPWSFAVAVAVAVAVVVVVGATSSCLSDVSIPPNAVLLCDDQAECPQGTTCEEGRCEIDGGNRAPRLLADAPARSVDDISVDVTVFDVNADDVTLGAEIVDGAAVHTLAVEPAVVAGSVAGTAATVSVSSPAALLTSGPLPRELTLRLTSTDGARTGAPVEVPVLFGNEAPQLFALAPLLLLVGDGPVGVGDDVGAVRGIVELTFIAADSSSDAVDVVGFRVTLPDGGGSVDIAVDDVNFPGGAAQRTGLATSPEGTPHTLEWDSGAGAAVAVGAASGDVTVELIVRDAFGAESSVASEPFPVDNAPAFDTVDVLDETGGAGGRALDRQGFLLTVTDPNAQQTVDVVVEVALDFDPVDGTATFVPATAHPDSDTLTQVGAEGGGGAGAGVISTVLYVWDVRADITPVLLETSAAPGGAPAVSELVAPFTPSVALRFSIVDAGGLGGDAVVVGPLAIGNDPPVVALAPVTPGSGGLVPIAFDLSDSSADLSSVELQFSLDVTDPVESARWRTMKLDVGLVDDLPVTTSPSRFVVLWDSLAEPSDVDISAPQGIGRRLLQSVGIRVRTRDEPRPGSLFHFGPRGGVAEGRELVVPLSNQTPPVLEPVLIADQGGIRNGAVPVVYRLIDEESDPAHIAFEFAVDTGADAQFAPCTEAPLPQSEGRLGLASAPRAAGGVVHTFIWDTGSDINAPSSSVQLRARVVDEFVPLDDPANASPGTVVSLLQATPFDPGPAFAGGAPFARTDVQPVPSFASLAAADFDRDGNADFVVGGFGGFGPQFDLWRGDGAGAFTGPTGIGDPAIHGNASYVVSDFDGNGNADIFVQSFGGGRLLCGSGSAAGGDFALVDDGTDLPCLDCAGIPVDVDGDGRLDLVGTVSAANTTQVFLSRGTGAAWSLVDTGFSAPAVLTALAADFDGDGGGDLALVFRDDFATPDVDESRLEVFRGSGTPGGAFTLATAPLASTSPAGIFAAAVAALDLDGDDVVDIVTQEARVGLLQLHRGNGDGTFTLVDEAESVGFPFDVVLTDFNGDGAPDFLVPSLVDNDVAVTLTRLEAGRRAGFGSTVRVPVGSVTAGAVAADFDNSGTVDFATAATGESAGATVAVFRSVVGAAAPGSFAAGAVVTPPGPSRGAPVPLDVDADGAVDLAITVEFGTVTVARGRRSGALTSSWDVQYGALDPGATFQDAKRFADVDADGAVDVLACTLGERRFLLHRGVVDGDGLPTADFAPVEALSGPDECTDEFGVGDVDADGDVDAVVGLAFPNDGVALFRNDGAGAFTREDTPIAGLAGGIGGVAVADVNLDGRADVAFVDQSGLDSGRIGVMLSQGASFAAPLNFATTTESGQVSIGDVDTDGFPDILSFTEIAHAPGDDVVTVVRGSGVGPAWTGTIVRGTASFSDQTRSVAALADVDLDGFLDVMRTALAPGDDSIMLMRGNAQARFDERVDVASLRNLSSVTAVDVNLDGAPDLVGTVYLTGAIALHAGRTSLPLQGIARAVAGDVAAAGAGVADVAWREELGGGFGDNAAISVRRVSGADDPLAGAAAGQALDVRGDLLGLWRREGVLATTPARPLTGAHYASGDVRLVRVREPVPGTGGDRLELVQRFGARLDAASATDFRRAGLSLAQGRAVVVDVPFLAGRVPAGPVRVLLRIPRWRTADEVPSDPLGGDPEAARYLPRIVDDAGGFRDVVHVSYETVEVPFDAACGDAGAGPVDAKCFLVDLEGRRIRVVTDELGALQAFD